MRKAGRVPQAGMTLIEVLISVLILAIGLLGAAAIQLNALKYTDSSAMSSQASFIAYDMMDRIRANVIGNATGNGATNVLATYALANLAATPARGTDARSIDLNDFQQNVTNLAGTDGANSSIAVNGQVVTITILWNDTRAASASDQALAATASGNQRSFQIRSQIGVTTIGATP
ncbi:type IV pilus modification protein PilV [uncultured Pseudomonas sp.]|uniref:type IV pilus modification protein PilV n=1 Tax=uncultured Pseudomonas sp. TaxID=114707 RepID=UPI0025D638A7|nr:type IV pilus modification protein PilV [uncultured Pseudomonas sp.]